MGGSPTAAQNSERLGLLTMLMKLNDLDSFSFVNADLESGVGRETTRLVECVTLLVGTYCLVCWHISSCYLFLSPSAPMANHMILNPRL